MISRMTILVALVGALVRAGCESPTNYQAPASADRDTRYGQQQTAAEQAIAVEVGMTDEGDFVLADVTVQAGQTVLWRNTSSTPHTVTADPQRAQDADNVQLPEGAETFHSGELAPGDTFEHTFEVPGSYRYVCLPHEGMGMIGQIHVEPAD